MRSRHASSSRKRYSRHTKSSLSKLRAAVWQILLLLFVLGIAYKQVRSHFQQPQAVLVLGGAEEREIFAAQFAHEHPNLPIWISSGGPPGYVEWVFSEAGISTDRVYLDYEAEDTVTNFTTLVDDLKSRNINSIYLITSDYHMRRARVIGEIVLGSRGIDFKPIPIPSGQSPEPMSKVIRDGVRAMLWVLTGRTGSTFGRLLSHHFHP